MIVKIGSFKEILMLYLAYLYIEWSLSLMAQCI